MTPLIILFFVLVFSRTETCFAETLYLKSGQIVRGQIVENTGYAVRIRADGRVRTYFGNEIFRIVKDDENIFEMTEDEKKKKESTLEKKTLILRMLEANHVRDDISRLLVEITADAPDDARQEVNALLKTDEVLDKIVAVYSRHYSIEDIEGLIEFYKSPLGQKHLRVTPLIMEETMQELIQFLKEKSAVSPAP